MAITKQMRTDVSQLYVSLFGRAPDAEGLSYWVGELGAGKSLTAVADAMFATAPARAYYPNYMTNEEIISSFYKNVLGRTGDAEGVQYWTKQLDSGTAKGKVFVDIMNATVKYNGTDAAALQSQAWFNSRVATAQTFGENGGTAANATIALNGWKADATTFVDAESFAGIKQYASVGSSADLTLEDVRSVSYNTTVRMQSTDAVQTDRGLLSADNALDSTDDQKVTKDASDMVVLFAKEFIQAPGTSASGAQLRIDLADVLNLKANSNGLSALPYDGFSIMVGTKEVKLAIDFSKLTADDEYSSFITAINAALVTAGYAGISASALPQESVVFSKTVISGGITYVQGSNAGNMTPILLTNSGAEAISMGNYSVKSGASLPNGNLVQTWTANPSSSLPSLTQVGVTVDDVGRSCQGGDLIVGGMDDCGGIEQFNLVVERTSNLNELASTLDKLEVVNVTNGTTKGNLSIDALNDVRVFDAHAMVGAVDLKASLTANVVNKYLNLTDTQADPAADNSEIAYNGVASTNFLYDLGTANDKLVLDISPANLDKGGTSTREDFVLVVNGNAGNDDITVTTGSLVNAAASNWYANQKLTTKVAINGGEGNDVVRTPMAGDFKIDLGAGDDVAYTGNEGVKQAWVLNAVPDKNIVDNLLSNADTPFGFQFGSKVAVTFKGITVSSQITDLGTSTALEINQIVKTLINGNANMSKLLTVADGPANTLVITSKIDGIEADNLAVAVTAPTESTLSTALVSQYNAAKGTSLTAAQIAALTYNSTSTYNLQVEENSTTPVKNVTGANSMAGNNSDDIITGGTGNDVVVLSTDAESNETLVYAASFGDDVVVHFNAAGTINGALPTAQADGKDKIDFTAIGGKGTATATDAGYIKVGEVNATNDDTAAAVAGLIGAKGGVYVAVDGDNIGTVWQVTNATTAVKAGTIDLADTAWSTLTAVNFA